MNIVSKKSEKVKTFCAEKWTEHKILSFQVSQKMMKINKARGYRMRDCGTFIKMTYCNDCDSYFVESTNLCRDRFCPTCNWRLSLQRYVNMKLLLDDFYLAYPKTVITFLTLTAKNCNVKDLSSTMEKMSKAWHNLNCRRTVKKEIRGTARSVEVTYTKNTKEFHPHYHVLIAWESENKKECEILSKDIINKWLECCEKNELKADIKGQCAKNIYGEEIKKENGEKNDSSMASAVVEVFKYAFKSKQLDDMPLNIFRTFAEEFAGKRLVSFTGKFADYARALKLEMEKIKEDDIKICKHCGSENLDKMIYEWSFGEQAYKRIQ